MQPVINRIQNEAKFILKLSLFTWAPMKVGNHGMFWQKEKSRLKQDVLILEFWTKDAGNEDSEF